MFTLVYNNKYYYATEEDKIRPSGSLIPMSTYPTLEEAEKGAKLLTRWYIYRLTIKNVNTGEEIPYLNGVRVKKKDKPVMSLETHVVASFNDIPVIF